MNAPVADPGVPVEERTGAPPTITGVPTSITALVGTALDGPVGQPVRVRARSDYERTFGGLSGLHPMAYSVAHFFENGGHDAIVVRVGGAGPPGVAAIEAGLEALREVDLFNLLVVPPAPTATPGTWSDLAPSTVARAIALATARRAFYLQDAPAGWTSVAAVTAGATSLARSANAAIYWPYLVAPDPDAGGRLRPFAPSGAIAGLIARTDAMRGVWKASAGAEATLVGASGLAAAPSDGQVATLNALGVNTLRRFSNRSPVAWGARTLMGADGLASEWKYIPVRRLALFLEESLARGTQWAVFEPNDETLWSRVRLAAQQFLHELFRAGGLAGTSPRAAYFVGCDRTTTTQADIANGVFNLVVGFAPLKPAEFVILRIRQSAVPG